MSCCISVCNTKTKSFVESDEYFPDLGAGEIALHLFYNKMNTGYIILMSLWTEAFSILLVKR